MVHKQHPSSFTGTDLGEHLEKVGKKKIVLAGGSTLLSFRACHWPYNIVVQKADLV